jgi:hypothetical protein
MLKQLYVANSHSEFHKNTGNILFANTTSQTDGQTQSTHKALFFSLLTLSHTNFFNILRT